MLASTGLGWSLILLIIGSISNTLLCRQLKKQRRLLQNLCNRKLLAKAELEYIQRVNAKLLIAVARGRSNLQLDFDTKQRIVSNRHEQDVAEIEAAREHLHQIEKQQQLKLNWAENQRNQLRNLILDKELILEEIYKQAHMRREELRPKIRDMRGDRGKFWATKKRRR